MINLLSLKIAQKHQEELRREAHPQKPAQASKSASTPQPKNRQKSAA